MFFIFSIGYTSSFSLNGECKHYSMNGHKINLKYSIHLSHPKLLFFQLFLYFFLLIHEEVKVNPGVQLITRTVFFCAKRYEKDTGFNVDQNKIQEFSTFLTLIFRYRKKLQALSQILYVIYTNVRSRIFQRCASIFDY